MMLKRTAKSCRSDAPMLESSLREGAQATVSNKPGHRGEREVSRKTIAQGRPGLLRCTCGDYARVLYLIRTRGFCNGPRRVNPFLRHPLAGHLLLSGIGAGPSPDGVHERNRSANLRKA